MNPSQSSLAKKTNLLIFSAALLSACGGGSDGHDTSPSANSGNGSGGGGAPITRSGQLDMAFGNGGKAVVAGNTNVSSDTPQAMALDSNGNIFIAGLSQNDVPAPDTFATSGYAPYVLKLDSTGKPVSGFGTTGKVKPAGERFFQTSGGTWQVSTAPGENGGVYVAQCGSTSVQGNQLTVFKLDATGKAVTEFGNSGIVSVDACYPFGATVRLLRDGSGNLYLVGSGPLRDVQISSNGTSQANSTRVTKLDINGKAVTGFGTGGSLSFSFTQDSLDTVYDAALDRQGNLYVFGLSKSSAGETINVIKFDSNGKRDVAFGTSGLAVVADVTQFLVAGESGTLTFAGISGTAAAGYALTVIKLDSNGKPLSGFGDSGKKRVALGPISLSFSTIAVDSSGNLYAAGSKGGSMRTDCTSDFAVIKIDARGELATGFGDGGRVLVDFGNGNEGATAIALDANNRIYLAGKTNATCTDPVHPSSLGYNASAITRLFP